MPRKGPFKCYVILFFWKLDPDIPPRNANNIEPYTFVTLVPVKIDTPHPHLRYVALEWPEAVVNKSRAFRYPIIWICVPLENFSSINLYLKIKYHLPFLSLICPASCFKFCLSIPSLTFLNAVLFLLYYLSSHLCLYCIFKKNIIRGVNQNFNMDPVELQSTMILYLKSQKSLSTCTCTTIWGCLSHLFSLSLSLIVKR